MCTNLITLFMPVSVPVVSEAPERRTYMSMLMRDAFAALLRDGEFASQFHLSPLAIPRRSNICFIQQSMEQPNLFHVGES